MGSSVTLIFSFNSLLSSSITLLSSVTSFPQRYIFSVTGSRSDADVEAVSVPESDVWGVVDAVLWVSAASPPLLPQAVMDNTMAAVSRLAINFFFITLSSSVFVFTVFYVDGTEPVLPV